ncbi:hypothetical protein ABZ641_17090, partial [Kitasatospora sp. NPDC007106]
RGAPPPPPPAAEPRVLALDGAIAALDLSVQAQIPGLPARIRAETGPALPFLTHDLGDPQEPCRQGLFASVPKPGRKPRSRDESLMCGTAASGSPAKPLDEWSRSVDH